MYPFTPEMLEIRARGREIVRELKGLEEVCPNPRDYERYHEFEAAYAQHGARVQVLQDEARGLNDRFRPLFAAMKAEMQAAQEAM